MKHRPPVARYGDPVTSHLAAASVRQTASEKLRDEIMRVLKLYGPQTDEGIAELLSALAASPSGLRTRRAELVEQGLVESVSTDGRTRGGRRCQVWSAVNTDTMGTLPFGE